MMQKTGLPFRNLKSRLTFLLIGLLMGSAYSQPMYVHDPVVISENGKYHLYCTSQGIASFESTDLEQWRYTGPVFSEIPPWTYEAVSDFNGHIWAPDIIYHKGIYFLYYSISAFAKNTSCIGVATNLTLDTADSDYAWQDHGIVVQSVPNRDLWNAIDPNIAFDDDGNAWMTFGSFWEGMKLVQLDSSLLQVQQPEVWHTLSRRERSFNIPDQKPGDGAVEAPFLFKNHGYYYLFVSFDFCCRGVESTYKIMVGRSKNITGPYLDREGLDLFLGGGTLVLEGDIRYPGLGHNSVYTFHNTDYLVFHAYDSEDEGRPVLRIVKLNWDEEKWPVPDLWQELNCSILK